jgi:hypothetical protein
MVTGAKIDWHNAWPNPRRFKIHPVCEALIAVFDEYKFMAARKHGDGYWHYNEVAEHQGILLVRTSGEEELSLSISFDSSKMKHSLLPEVRIWELSILFESLC